MVRVYLACSKEDNINPEYKELASIISEKLASNGFILVSKCFDTGMSYASFMTYKYEEMEVIGISEVSNAEVIDSFDLDDAKVVKNTFERTKEIFSVSDLVIVLPGGLGTISELFSMIEEVRVKGIKKRIILFNYNNYYSNILKFLVNAHNEGFISEHDIKLISIVNNIETLCEFLERMER